LTSPPRHADPYLFRPLRSPPTSHPVPVVQVAPALPDCPNLSTQPSPTTQSAPARAVTLLPDYPPRAYAPPHRTPLPDCPSRPVSWHPGPCRLPDPCPHMPAHPIPTSLSFPAIPDPAHRRLPRPRRSLPALHPDFSSHAVPARAMPPLPDCPTLPHPHQPIPTTHSGPPHLRLSPDAPTRPVAPRLSSTRRPIPSPGRPVPARHPDPGQLAPSPPDCPSHAETPHTGPARLAIPSPSPPRLLVPTSLPTLTAPPCFPTTQPASSRVRPSPPDYPALPRARPCPPPSDHPSLAD
jgi:hypothetical protein